MTKGSSATIELTFPFTMEDKDFYISIGQRDKEIIRILSEDCEVENNMVSFVLGAEVTSGLLESANMQVQSTIYNSDGTVAKSIIKEEPVYKAVQP